MMSRRTIYDVTPLHLLLLMSVAGPPDWVIRRMGGKYLMYLHNPGPGDPTEFDADGNPVYK
jgi:hypothetical protein